MLLINHSLSSIFHCLSYFVISEVFMQVTMTVHVFAMRFIYVHMCAIFSLKCGICRRFWDYIIRKIYSLLLIFKVYIATYTPESYREMQMNEEKQLSKRIIKQKNELISTFNSQYQYVHGISLNLIETIN